MSRYLRYLRIAFSVTCGIACVLLVVLWARSYWWWDRISYYTSPDDDDVEAYGVDLDSWHGVCSIRTYPLFEWAPVSFLERWQLSIKYPPLWLPEQRWNFKSGGPNEDHDIKVPHWFLAVLAATLAAAPWIRWRFSLRTMLIAITLIAVVLGTIVWLNR